MRLTLSTAIFLIFLLQKTHAQDTLDVRLNKRHLTAGDTLSADCYLKTMTIASPATLNVWIEGLDKSVKWRFRYPVVNGVIAFDLKIGDSLPAGRYAINFLVQPDFFAITGKIENYDKKMKEVNMVMLSKDSEQVLSSIRPDPFGNFSTSKFVFEDAAKFTFYPASKKAPDLVIDIQTNLDSAFTPLITHTELISIGDTTREITNDDKEYKFNDKHFTQSADILPEVIMTTSLKKNVQKFNEEYATGLFKGDARVFDGIDDPQLSSSPNLAVYLAQRVTGLETKIFGNGVIIFRYGALVSVFVDEQPYTGFEPLNVKDIAMIKIFDPYTGPVSTQGGGSIAIYLKKGKYLQTEERKRNSFIVQGFSPAYIVWK